MVYWQALKGRVVLRHLEPREDFSVRHIDGLREPSRTRRMQDEETADVLRLMINIVAEEGRRSGISRGIVAGAGKERESGEIRREDRFHVLRNARILRGVEEGVTSAVSEEGRNRRGRQARRQEK